MLKNRTTRILLAVLTIVVVVLAIFEIKSIIDQKKKGDKVVATTKQIGPYTVLSDQTELQKKLEPELKAALDTKQGKQIVKEAGRYFISEYFTLFNKTNPKAIGGIGFVFEPTKETFRTNAFDSYYMDLPQFIKSYGKENLPLVDTVKAGALSKVHISNVQVPKNSKLTVLSVYDVAVSWTYEKNDKNQATTLVNKGRVRFVKASDGNWYVYEFINADGADTNE